jgi:hypothetical protein
MSMATLLRRMVDFNPILVSWSTLLRSLSVYVMVGLGIGLTVSITIFVDRLFPTLEAYAILNICSHQHFSPTVNIMGTCPSWTQLLPRIMSYVGGYSTEVPCG